MAKQNVERQQADLDVGEDRAWQERFWTAQRIGWVLMALFVLAALAGLTGKGGALATASADIGGATLEYPRITRWQSDEQIQLRLSPSAPETAELFLSREFVELFAINSIQPEASSAKATAAGHRFTFETQAGSAERVIAFNVRAGKPVLQKQVSAALGNAQPAQMTVTVLP